MRIIFLLVLTLSACTKNSSENPQAEPPLKEIRIGEYAPMTGNEATFGVNSNKGITLAVEEINAKGGIRGIPVKLFVQDTQSLDSRVEPAVKNLVRQQKVLALIGEISSNRSLIGARLAQKWKIPMITPGSTNPKVTKVGNHIFRVCFIDSFQGRAMAKFAAQNLKAKKIAILKNSETDYSRGLANEFRKNFEGLGGKIVSEHTYKSGDTDFSEQLRRMGRHKPKAVFIPGYYTEVGYIARQARQLGIQVALLGGDGWDSTKLFEFAKEAINGSYFSNHFTTESDDPLVRDFIVRFKTRFGIEPDGSAALGYDAAGVLLDAIQRSPDFKPNSIRKEIAKTREFLGVTGQITIDASRNAKKSLVVVQIDGTTNRFITTIKP